ncbi:MAG TPA: Ig-like domain-containing protein [Polyangiaceae bacterium]|nr:Ig-like domain-containing protein [Polyangiaceae bacterium]
MRSLPRALLTLIFFLAALATFGCGGRSDEGLMLGRVVDAGPDRKTVFDSGGGGAGSDRVDAASPDGGGPVVLVGIAVTPPSSTLAVTTRVLLTVTGNYSNGSVADLTPSASFTSDAPAVASVASNVVTARAAGTAVVTAIVNGLRADAKIVVTAATIRSIAVTPAVASTGIGGTVDFTATATLSDGTHQDVTASASWTSSNTAVATVSLAGRAQGVAAGGTTIAATLGAFRGTATLNVSGATLVSISLTPTNPVFGSNVTVRFTAIGTYSDRSIADVTAAATWKSTDSNVVVVTPSGIGTTIAAGTSIVSATVGAIAGTTTVTVTTASLQSITVVPAMTTLAIGGSVQLKATGNYSDDTSVDLTASVTWSSSATGIAAVSNAAGQSGFVTALSGGSATISATLGTAAGKALVTVTPATLKQIDITPQNPSVPKQAKVSFIARGTYSDGSVIDVTTTATWSSDEPGIASISNADGSNGVATAVSLGATRVRVTLDGISATAGITVTGVALVSLSVTPANSTMAAGTKQLMRAVGVYSDMTTIDLTASAVWTTGNDAIASVSNASGAQGLLTSINAGSTTVSATAFGITGSTSVTVTSPALNQVVVTPIAPSRPTGQQVQFTATAIFDNGTQRNVTGQAMWASSNTAVATVGNNGQVTTTGAGSSVITATFNGTSGTSTLTVTAATVVSITVAPIALTLPAGTVQQFQASAIFSDNTSQNITGQATWSSSVPAVAGVGTNGFMRGRVTALTAGTADIRATWQGITGSSTLTVTAATIVSVQVTPIDESLTVGNTLQYAAVAIYSDGTSRTVTGQSTWVSTVPSVAGITTGGQGMGGGMGGNRGQAKGLSAGTTTIRATFSGITGTTTLTVTDAKLVTIQVTPFSPKLPVGFVTAFYATGIYSDNTTQDLTLTATWASSAGGVAGVSNSGATKGRVTPIAAGGATITATYQGVLGKSDVTVSQATLQSITIAPAATRIAVQGELQYTATGTFSDASQLDVTQYATWLSSVPGVADVSNAVSTRGLAKGLATGTVTISAVRDAITGTASLDVF